MKLKVISHGIRPGQAGVAGLGFLYLWVLLLTAGSWGLWWHYQQPSVSTASAAGGRFAGAGGSRAQPVSTGLVRQQDLRVVVPAIGSLVALNTAMVRTRVEGELKSLHFKEGQQVEAGQLLAEIDPRAYEVQLAQAQGQLARDQAQLKNAQLDLARYQDLLAKDSIARQQVDTQEALVRQLQGTVQVDQGAVDSARLQLSYTRVVAPLTGRLGLKLADLGNVVKPGDANGLVSITQTRPIAVVFAVPETWLGQINRQLKAGQALPVEAWDREMRQRLANGRVISTDNAIDSATGTIKLKAEFPNADDGLFPNQFVNIRLQVEQRQQVLTVPAPAVQRGSLGTFVYVVAADNAVSARKLELGPVDGDWVQVTPAAGVDLKPGDRVVTDGADRLRDGARVEVIRPATSTRPAAAAQARPSAGSAAPAAVASAAPAAASSPARMPAAPASSAPEPGQRPAWMDRLPPELVEKLMAMPPEERRAFLQRLRERRQREAQ